MATGEHSLKQVCYETGYQSYNDFYRNFRKVTGVSPKDFVHAEPLDKP
jgi:YesN/AraC family two-component response regulator